MISLGLVASKQSTGASQTMDSKSVLTKRPHDGLLDLSNEACAEHSAINAVQMNDISITI